MYSINHVACNDRIFVSAFDGVTMGLAAWLDSYLERMDLAVQRRIAKAECQASM